MPRRKLTKSDFDRRTKLANELVEFRRTYLFTQVKLSEALGISRRALQLLEGELTALPRISTLQKFAELKRKWISGKAA